MAQEPQRSESNSIVPWDPARVLRKVDPLEAKLSRGFLRCRPERWLPGFAAQWLPLGHSLGLEIEIGGIKPTLTMPASFDRAFWGSVDDEPVGICFEEESVQLLLEALAPGANAQAGAVVLEYLARRVFTTVAMAWSGPAFSDVRFLGKETPRHALPMGAVKVSVSLNENTCTVWLCLGRFLVESLDGLWRRQIQSSVKRGEERLELRMEVAWLAVPPSMLSEYLKAETVIDLEVPVSDTVTLRTGDKPWLPARLCIVGQHFGFEVLPGAVAASALPEGTTRMVIELGTLSIERGSLSELSQPGAVWQTEIPISNQVQLFVSREKVREATLCAYEGRFAVTVAG